MAQVLELGMIAETESSLTFLVAASLFIWHASYASGRLNVWSWSLAYALAALAGLTKGPQGPVYFVAVTTVYLCVQRDWRTWLSWRHAAAALTMLGVLAAWQIPFTLRTDLTSSGEIWVHNASDRFVESSWLGFARHLAVYPFEVAACMLPWSFMLIAYCYPRVRARLDHTAPLVKFTVIALLVTFPSCWLAATARGRYFMPLYPCIAVLVGVAIDRIVQLAQDAQLEYAIQRFLWPCAVILPFGAVAMLIVGMFDGNAASAWTAATDSPWMSVAFTVVATLGGWLVARAAREVRPERVRWGLLAIAGFIGFTYMGPVANVRIAHSEDTAGLIADLRAQLPDDAEDKLVSVGRVHHLFAYYYRDPIRMLPVENLHAELGGDWEYFCVDQPGAETPALPFPWERVAVISCERNRLKNPQQKVVVGRRLKNADHTAGRGEDHARK